MIAAKRFQDSNIDWCNVFAIAEATTPRFQLAKESSNAVKVVLDFQHRDWRFVSQPGLYPTLSDSEILLTAFRRAPSNRNEYLRECPEVYRERLYPSHTPSTRRWSSRNGRRRLRQRHHYVADYPRLWTRDFIRLFAAETLQPFRTRRYIRLRHRTWAFNCVSN